MKERREFSSRTRAESCSHLDFNSSAAYQVLARVVVSHGCMTWRDSTSQLELFAHISSFQVATDGRRFIVDSQRTLLRHIRCDDITRIHIMHENRKPEKITWENSQKKNRHNKKLAQQCRWHHQSHFCCYSDVSSWLKIRLCRVEKAECVGGGFV